MAGRRETRWREPTEDERILLNLAVRALPQTVLGSYEHQLEGIKVRFDCECGCPSLEIRLAEGIDAATETLAPRDVGNAFFDDESGPCSVVLFMEEGRLRNLELVRDVANPSPGARLTRVTEGARNDVVLYEREGE